ncbi:hypothetical protein B296_00036583, partial [Ensete ventricosum]
MLVLQIVTKHLKQDNGNIQSSSKPQTESLLAQVASVSKTSVVYIFFCGLRVPIAKVTASTTKLAIRRHAPSRLQRLSHSRGSGTYVITAVTVFGAVGYLCIWWKETKLGRIEDRQ